VVTRNPTRIGRYELITALATGGMGRIWLGRAAGIGGFERKFVIKTLELPRDTAEAEAASAMFLDEARLLGLLHHQHLASVFEVGQDDGRYYMVLDYLDGHSAHDVWERASQFGAALPLDFTLTVASAVANGLHHAHTCKGLDGVPLGIVHRDVTPSNVMIGYDGGVQLIDFGIAMAAERKTKTQTGLVKGKVSYLSPEQVTGRDVDPRTDVFALGILLYEMSTMHRAFRDSSDLATMQRIKAGRVTRPSLVVPNYPLELEIIVMKALQVDPRERFADADAMRRALEALGHRLHLVLGDAAVIEVMAQLFDDRAADDVALRASDPVLEWDSDHDLTVRREPGDLLARLRAEHAANKRRDAVPTAPELPTVRPRKLRAATEAAELIIRAAEPPVMPMLSSPDTPSGITQPAEPAASPPADLGFDGATVRAAHPADLGFGGATVRAGNPADLGFGGPTLKTETASRMIGAHLVEARSSRRARLRWVGVAIAAVVVAAPIVYFLTRDSSDAVAGASSHPAAVAPAPAPVPPPDPAPPPVPDPAPPLLPAKVRVRIVTHPTDATVVLDSRRLGKTPLDETMAAEPGKHVIRLRRKGYAPHKLEVSLDADIMEDITLTPQK
jgi:eukaryotic-like serine/threonine-protein kinase